MEISAIDISLHYFSLHKKSDIYQ